ALSAPGEKCGPAPAGRGLASSHSRSRPPQRARSHSGRAPVPSPRSVAPRSPKNQTPAATTDIGNASSTARPAGPESCRNPQKLTVFLQRARHGEVTSRDPAFREVRPLGAGPHHPHGSAPCATAGETPLSSAAPPPTVALRAGAHGLCGRLLGRGLLERLSPKACGGGANVRGRKHTPPPHHLPHPGSAANKLSPRELESDARVVR
ncbi:unnamed protein product, partial [Gulo gulo]